MTGGAQAVTDISPSHETAAVPPLSKGGVPIVEMLDNHGVGGPIRFDWYAASIHADVETVRKEIHRIWTKRGRNFDTVPGGSYDYRTEVSLFKKEIAVSWGKRYQWPYVNTLSGEFSPNVAQFCRRWPHAVTRLDAKIDIWADWKDAADRASEIAISQRLGTPVSRHVDDQDVGAGTLYIGSRKNKKILIRVYDKTKEMLERHRIIIPDGIVRVELEYRPQHREAKMQASSMEPMDLFGMTRTARAIYEEFSGQQADPIRIAKGEGNTLGALKAMMAQYGDQMAAMAEELGSWAELGEYLECLAPEGEALREKWMANARTRRSAH